MREIWLSPRRGSITPGVCSRDCNLPPSNALERVHEQRHQLHVAGTIHGRCARQIRNLSWSIHNTSIQMVSKSTARKKRHGAERKEYTTLNNEALARGGARRHPQLPASHSGSSRTHPSALLAFAAWAYTARAAATAALQAAIQAEAVLEVAHKTPAGARPSRAAPLRAHIARPQALACARSDFRGTATRRPLVSRPAVSAGGRPGPWPSCPRNALQKPGAGSPQRAC